MQTTNAFQQFIRSSKGQATSIAVAASIGVAILGYSLYHGKHAPAAAESDTGAHHAPGTGTSGVDATGPEESSSSVIQLSNDKLQSLGLVTEPVQARRWAQRLRVTGRLELNRSRIAHVSALVQGVVRDVRVEIGQNVEQGEVLSYIDSREVGEAKLEFVRQQLEYECAQKNYEWQKTILDNTRALLAALDDDQPAAATAEQFENRPIGSYREQLLSALARFTRATADYQRSRRLGASEIIPEKDVIRAKAEYESSRAAFRAMKEQIKFDAQRQELLAQQRLQKAEAAVAISRSHLLILGYSTEDIDSLDPLGDGERVAFYPLKSPCAGTVIGKHAPLSQHVTAQTELFEIADLSTVWLRADIFEKDLAAIGQFEGKTITFQTTSYPDREFVARVFSLGNMVDDETRAARMLAIAENPQRQLKPGMFVEIELAGDDGREVVQVPTSAVQRYEGATFVFVRSGAGQFERRDVQIGRSSADTIEIASGLAESEVVVVKGGFALKSEMLSELMVEE
jgi:cobalt-zinc-cadmium efflux system membrane fusion protein